MSRNITHTVMTAELFEYPINYTYNNNNQMLKLIHGCPLNEILQTKMGSHPPD